MSMNLSPRRRSPPFLAGADADPLQRLLELVGAEHVDLAGQGGVGPDVAWIWNGDRSPWARAWTHTSSAAALASSAAAS